MAEEAAARGQRARLRAYKATAARLARATEETVNALMGDLDGDRMGLGIAHGQVIEAERDTEAALTLLKDLRRSLEDG